MTSICDEVKNFLADPAAEGASHSIICNGARACQGTLDAIAEYVRQQTNTEKMIVKKNMDVIVISKKGEEDDPNALSFKVFPSHHSWAGIPALNVGEVVSISAEEEKEEPAPPNRSKVYDLSVHARKFTS